MLSDKRNRENRSQNLFTDRLQKVVERIHAARTIDEILIGARDRLLSLFDADKIIIYAYDPASDEVFTRFLRGSAIKEQRLAAHSKNIPGLAVSGRKPVVIEDVYDASELASRHKSLAFDPYWDKCTGFRTRALMAVPILCGAAVAGVVVITNPKHRDRFTARDVSCLETVCRRIGCKFKDKLRLNYPARLSYLADASLISHDDLRRACELAGKEGVSIETLLMDRYQILKKDIGIALSRYFGCGFFDYSDPLSLPKEVIKGINPDYLKRVCWVPVAVNEKKVVVAIDDPFDAKKAEVAGLLNRGKVEFQVALKEDIRRVIEAVCRESNQKHESVTDLLEELSGNREEALEEEDVYIREDAGVIVRLVRQLIVDGYNAGASDIHVEPDVSRKHTRIRFRVDGQCVRYQTFPLHYTAELVSRLKIMANLDIAEKRLPQDGKIKFKYMNKEIELRIATVPTVMGENLVMRILASSKPILLHQLGLSGTNLSRLEHLIERPYGIFLVVGPTGSGKTTSLHSVLHHINTPERKIWTAEDPVEITQEGLCQVEVKPKINYTFAAALRSFLRADPDVIMIGEMRDLETAAIAVEASLTGHLVLSTLHTNSAPETITRLVDMGIDPFNFADAFLGVLAQRLVRALCTRCRAPYHPEPREADRLVAAYGGHDLFRELNTPDPLKATLYRANGCRACNHTGYKGRIAIQELLATSREVKGAIQKNKPPMEIWKLAAGLGMRSLYQDGIAKVFAGLTDFAQVKMMCTAV